MVVSDSTCLIGLERIQRLVAVRPVIEALQRERFFMSEALIAEALRLAGE